ncbi:hypothetical protein QBC37DRAFT_282323 [Rhypophila decipiens]|uniref:Uncharacterized protein n=1 Tax=Rhypophila decipiens TaxID=261697 RepID=A0AAN6YAG1_9PEZI|nr:hypothetical protein QBC37DRAFT_282323 [Rhypophila decipiens]
MAVFNLKLAAIAAIHLLGSVLAAPAPSETFAPGESGSEPAPTPVNLPTGPAGTFVVDGEVVNSTDHRVVARQGTPGLRLMNCWPIMSGNGAPPGGWRYTSYVVYCDDMATCDSTLFTPSSNNVCVKKSSTAVNDYYIWEGGSKSCTFPTGVTFTWNIPSNAQSQADYSWVGTGSNTYRTFNGYKDNKDGSLHYPSFVQRCSKIYWYW